MILILLLAWSGVSYASNEVFGIFDLTGTIKSPGYPLNYLDNLNLKYVV
jgi:hypothetical protein